MVYCPHCGSELKAVRDFNPEVFGDGKNNPICRYVCLNHNCKGWYCRQCQTYHPFGTTCSVALVKIGRVNGDMVWGDERGRTLYRGLHRKVNKE